MGPFEVSHNMSTFLPSLFIRGHQKYDRRGVSARCRHRKDVVGLHLLAKFIVCDEKNRFFSKKLKCDRTNFKN